MAQSTHNVAHGSSPLADLQSRCWPTCEFDYCRNPQPPRKSPSFEASPSRKKISTQSLPPPIPLPPLPSQHAQRNSITPLPVIPDALPRTPLHHEPKPLIQLPSALVPRKSLDADSMQIGVPKSPFRSPKDRLGTVALILVRVRDGDADGGVAVVGAHGVGGVQHDGADRGVFWLFLFAGRCWVVGT
jgi:hypothetical protein